MYVMFLVVAEILWGMVVLLCSRGILYVREAKPNE